MKKPIVIIFVIYYLICSTIVGYASIDDYKLGFAPNVAAAYWKWAEIYEISDLDLSFEYSDKPTEKNEMMLKTDDIVVIYDNSNMGAKSVILETDLSKRDMNNLYNRICAFYSAIEYGNPVNMGPGEILWAKKQAIDFCTIVIEKMNESIKYPEKTFVDIKNTDKFFYELEYYNENSLIWLIFAL